VRARGRQRRRPLDDQRLALRASVNTICLRGVAFVRKPYKAARKPEPRNHSRKIHDHAEFVRGAGGDWACPECFTLFREPMGGGKAKSEKN